MIRFDDDWVTHNAPEMTFSYKDTYNSYDEYIDFNKPLIDIKRIWLEIRIQINSVTNMDDERVTDKAKWSEMGIIQN